MLRQILIDNTLGDWLAAALVFLLTFTVLPLVRSYIRSRRARDASRDLPPPAALPEPVRVELPEPPAAAAPKPAAPSAAGTSRLGELKKPGAIPARPAAPSIIRPAAGSAAAAAVLKGFGFGKP